MKFNFNVNAKGGTILGLAIISLAAFLFGHPAVGSFFAVASVVALVLSIVLR